LSSPAAGEASDGRSSSASSATVAIGERNESGLRWVDEHPAGTRLVVVAGDASDETAQPTGSGPKAGETVVIDVDRGEDLQ
jgi:hypothetical protein